MLKFKKDELVLHPFFGAGTITGTQAVESSGTSQLYYTIELITGGMLMVPLREAEEARLHALISPEMMVDVLSAAPQELTDDVSQRRDHLEANINRGDPTRVTEMLRDLIVARPVNRSLPRGQRTCETSQEAADQLACFTARPRYTRRISTPGSHACANDWCLECVSKDNRAQIADPPSLPHSAHRS